MQDDKKHGTVFNVQKFSVHDGEGIRTLVFIKGCPLRCHWCSNPESQSMFPERAYNVMRCLTFDLCGKCIDVCKTRAMSVKEGFLLNLPSKCENCFRCVQVCPTGAQTLYGERMSVEEVLKRVEEDNAFYARSGGGLTLSGGEALTQPDFVYSLLREAQRRHINTAMETCGHASFEHLSKACQHLNQLIFDIKQADSEKHKQGTGVGNTLILANFARVVEEFPDLRILVRTPVIPGFNDSEEDIIAIRKLIPRRKGISYELLTYHRMGQPKYAYLGREYSLSDVKADEERMKQLRALAV